MKRTHLLFQICIIVLFGTLITSCHTPNAPQTSSELPEAASPSAEVEALEASQATTLTVCLKEIPDNVFLYGSLSEAGATVADALFDGPFDRVNGELQPRIFERVEITNEDVPVTPGTVVFTANESVEALNAETIVIPGEDGAACGFPGCSLALRELPDGAELRMSRVTVTYVLLEGLRWSDGEPLRADDSLFAYETFAGGLPIGDLIQTYERVDNRTIRVETIPGFIPPLVDELFFAPVPKHLYDGQSAQEILDDPRTKTAPLGWGAYRVKEGAELTGDEIVLETNPYYQALFFPPNLTEIRFIARGVGADNFSASVREDACQLTQSGIDFTEQIEPFLEDIRDRKVSGSILPTLTSIEIVLNPDAPNETVRALLNDPANRIALTQCVNRPQLIREILYGQSEVPVGFYPSFHQLNAGADGYIAYDVAGGSTQLAQLSWDFSQPMTLAYADTVTNARMAEFIRAAWEDCGISVETIAVAETDATIGTMAGYDAYLMRFTGGETLPCRAYLGEPGTVQLFTDEASRTACIAARGLKASGGKEFLDEVQRMLRANVATIPLAFEPRFAIVSPRVCGVVSVEGMRSVLWNVESLAMSETGSCYAPQWNNIYTGTE